MNSEIILIITGYILIGFLLTLFNLRTNFHWILKSSMIVLTALFYIFTYNSFKDLLGWPSSEKLPERFRLISAQIYEPNAILSSEGEIFLWITNMDNLAGLGEPRSHSLPYNKEVHEKISKALVNLKNGIPQMGEQSDENKESIISSITKKEKVIDASTKLNFFDMPNQLLPEK